MDTPHLTLTTAGGRSCLASSSPAGQPAELLGRVEYGLKGLDG